MRLDGIQILAYLLRSTGDTPAPESLWILLVPIQVSTEARNPPYPIALYLLDQDLVVIEIDIESGPCQGLAKILAITPLQLRVTAVIEHPVPTRL